MNTIIIHLLNDRPLSHRLIVEQFCKNPPIAERGRNCWQRTAKTGEEGKEVINRILLKMSLFSSLCFVCPDQRNTSQFTNSCAGPPRICSIEFSRTLCECVAPSQTHFSTPRRRDRVFVVPISGIGKHFAMFVCSYCANCCVLVKRSTIRLFR